MPQLNFSPQFAPSVEDGSKRQTIRAMRKVPIKLGDTLHHFTGLRQKGARRLRAPEICTAALDIVICTKPLKHSTYRSLEVRLQHKGKMHRRIWRAAHGEIPPGMEVLMRDGDKRNVAIENLMLGRPGEASRAASSKFYLEKSRARTRAVLKINQKTSAAPAGVLKSTKGRKAA